MPRRAARVERHARVYFPLAQFRIFAVQHVLSSHAPRAHPAAQVERLRADQRRRSEQSRPAQGGGILNSAYSLFGFGGGGAKPDAPGGGGGGEATGGDGDGQELRAGLQDLMAELGIEVREETRRRGAAERLSGGVGGGELGMEVREEAR